MAATGLPKLYAPVVKGSLGGPITFAARLSQPGGWTVTVRDPGGTVVARGTGRGAAIAWTWNSTGRRGGNYTWTMEAGPATRPAHGTFGRASGPGAPPAPAPSFLSALTVDPPVISPDGDGVADALTISYTLAVRAVGDRDRPGRDRCGRRDALFSAQLQGARTQSFPYAAQGLADGNYTLRSTPSARTGGRRTRRRRSRSTARSPG